MTSKGRDARLLRAETDLKKRAFRDYARSAFDDRSDRRRKLQHLNVIKDEEKRINKIRDRFKSKGDESKLELLRNVAKSRENLIPHLLQRAKERNKYDHKSSAKLERQEEDASGGQVNGIKELVDGIKELVDKANELVDEEGKPVNEIKELVGKVKEPVDKAKVLVDNAEELVDEFKAGVMYFRREGDRKWRGEQYVDVDSSSGDFPNQKVKMDSILSNTAKNRKLFKSDEECIKYFHFPANHMEWIEKAINKYYDVNKDDQEDYDEEENQVLSFEYWRGQLHGSGIGKGLFHLRHMRPRCAHISEDHTDHSAPSNIALFLPYLHWETNRRRSKMAQIVQELVEDNKTSLSSRIIEAAGDVHCLRPKFKRDSIPSKVGRYLYDVAQVWDAMDYEADERLLRQSFSEEARGTKCEPPLHIRRTLDQSYFSIVEDTAARDTDQVVYRQTRARKEKHLKHQEDDKSGMSSTSVNTMAPRSRHIEASRGTMAGTTFGSITSSDIATTKKKKKMTKLVGVTRVVMVDQLWMWILGEDTIITSFPRRWGRNKPDSSGVHKSLRKILGKRKHIRSIYHLATLIIDQCSKVFFDRTQPTDDRPEVMDLFAQAIGTVAYNTTSAYSHFWANVSLQSSSMNKENKQKPHAKKWLKLLGIDLENKARNREPLKYLNINPEGVLLKESQDIIEELNMMERIYKQQLTVVHELHKHMKSRHDKSQRLDDGVTNSSAQSKTANITKIDLEEATYLIEKIENRVAEINDFQKAVTRTNEQLQALLSLKQQDASIVEARTALERADESVQQGRAIMAFTIVTIFFLPLGFFTSLFGMNNKVSTGDEWMTMGEQLMYMFVISAAVISVILFVAFRWGSSKSGKLISVTKAIERHEKEKRNGREGNITPNNHDAIVKWNNATEGPRWRRSRTNISEV
ncbi:hypothetical protein V8C42DRAFT_315409 [Trichoderma barbatum]